MSFRFIGLSENFLPVGIVLLLFEFCTFLPEENFTPTRSVLTRLVTFSECELSSPSTETDELELPFNLL